MADINHVVLVGRLTRDAELKFTNSGFAVAKLGLAINRRKKAGDQWVDEANFFDVTVWGKQAESLNQYLTRGKQIAVEGELRQDRWEQDGHPRSRVYVSATNIMLLGGSGGNSQPAGGGIKKDNTSSKSFNSYPSAGMDMAEFEDDIPF